MLSKYIFTCLYIIFTPTLRNLVSKGSESLVPSTVFSKLCPENSDPQSLRAPQEDDDIICRHLLTQTKHEKTVTFKVKKSFKHSK